MKFLVDQMMGKLCKWLRIMGFDTEIIIEANSEIIKNKCILEARIFVTRSVKNYNNIKLPDSILINEENSYKQIEVILEKIDPGGKNTLILYHNFFSRCLECNTQVKKIEKELLKDRVPEKSYQYYDEFFECSHCKKIFWKGTHYNNTIKKLEKIIHKE